MKLWIEIWKPKVFALLLHFFHQNFHCQLYYYNWRCNNPIMHGVYSERNQLAYHWWKFVQPSMAIKHRLYIWAVKKAVTFHFLSMSIRYGLLAPLFEALVSSWTILLLGLHSGKLLALGQRSVSGALLWGQGQKNFSARGIGYQVLRTDWITKRYDTCKKLHSRQVNPNRLLIETLIVVHLIPHSTVGVKAEMQGVPKTWKIVENQQILRHKWSIFALGP